MPGRFSIGAAAGLSVAVMVAAVIYYLLSRGDKLEHHEAIAQVESGGASGTYLTAGRPTLVLYYADWCGWSKKIIPAWEKVKQLLLDSNAIQALDFEEKRDPEEIKRFQGEPDFVGYPDVRFYPDGYPSGKSIKYTGNRSEESLLQFAYSSGAKV